jgi:hypothetical protein
MSTTPSPFLVAAAPALSAQVDAVLAFIHNLGTDPMKLPLTVGPAVTVLIGQLGLQLPGLASAEWGVIQTDATTKLSGISAYLKGLGAAPAAPAPGLGA